MIGGSREACAGRGSEGVSVFVWASRDAESEGGGREDGGSRSAHAHTSRPRQTLAEHAHATAHGVRKPPPTQRHNVAQRLMFQTVRFSCRALVVWLGRLRTWSIMVALPSLTIL